MPWHVAARRVAQAWGPDGAAGRDEGAKGICAPLHICRFVCQTFVRFVSAWRYASYGLSAGVLRMIRTLVILQTF
jgi:hypothetical protein